MHNIIFFILASLLAVSSHATPSGAIETVNQYLALEADTVTVKKISDTLLKVTMTPKTASLVSYEPARYTTDIDVKSFKYSPYFDLFGAFYSEDLGYRPAPVNAALLWNNGTDIKGLVMNLDLASLQSDITRKGKFVFEAELTNTTAKPLEDKTAYVGQPIEPGTLKKAVLYLAVTQGRVFRPSDSGPCVLLPYTNCSAVNLAGLNLEGLDLRGGTFASTSFSGASLSVANLSYSNLSRANLAGSILSSAYLVSAELVNANIQGAAMNNVELSNASIEGLRGTPADLSGAGGCSSTKPTPFKGC